LLRVGLTGGIASGKSAIGDVLVSLGAHLLKADDIAHDLMRPGMPVYERVVQQFGTEILNPDKTIHRAKLAQAAFGGPNNPPRVQELNRIVHPAVLRAQEEWMDNIGGRDQNAIAVVEAALILEAGARHQFDRLIVVTCRSEQRAQRLAARLSISAEAALREVERRMAAQLSDEEKIKSADYVIDNSGLLEESQKRAREIFADLQRDLRSLENGAHTKSDRMNS
jgi:dephospho-CoA kinase